MTTKEQLVANLNAAKSAVEAAQAALEAFETSIENNVFDSMEAAEGTLEERLYKQAHADCEGSYNCGQDEYTQDFIVEGKRFRATLKCEYNRHDKTYYYIDGSDFSVAPLD